LVEKANVCTVRWISGAGAEDDGVKGREELLASLLKLLLYVAINSDQSNVRLKAPI
jgi:hypothetical protein